MGWDVGHRYSVGMGCQTQVQTELGWGVRHRYKQCWDGVTDTGTNSVGMWCQTGTNSVGMGVLDMGTMLG